MIDSEQLNTHAERIRLSGVLGRSGLLQKLFDFFVACSLAGKIPKEIEVALDVFGKQASFDVAQDAMVRVYVHKLRRKLDDYYNGPGKHESGRLVIPKGEYRFLFEESVTPDTTVSVDVAPTSADVATPAVTGLRRLSWIHLVAGLLLLINIALIVQITHKSADERALHAVRTNPLWSRILDDDLPITVAVGDYYIFGELDDESFDVKRLIREYNINSPTDLERYLKNNPELASRYMDLALNYLPTASAFALNNLIPVLEPNHQGKRRVQIMLASELTPATIKSSHVVYVGLLSGMGILRQWVFDNSGFEIGSSYDELIERKTQKHFMSQAGSISAPATKYRDLGFVYARTGDIGNQLIVMAGTRDVALQHMAELLSTADSLQSLEKAAGTDRDFEALLQVEAMDRTNISGHLLQTHQLQQTGTK